MQQIIVHNLKILRKKACLSQRALGKAIYVSRSLIAFYETSRTPIRPDSIYRISAYFNIPVEKLTTEMLAA